MESELNNWMNEWKENSLKVSDVFLISDRLPHMKGLFELTDQPQESH